MPSNEHPFIEAASGKITIYGAAKLEACKPLYSRAKVRTRQTTWIQLSLGATSRTIIQSFQNVVGVGIGEKSVRASIDRYACGEVVLYRHEVPQGN